MLPLLDVAVGKGVPSGGLRRSWGRLRRWIWARFIARVGRMVVAEVRAGHLRTALDVATPDPLSPEHPLRRSPGS